MMAFRSLDKKLPTPYYHHRNSRRPLKTISQIYTERDKIPQIWSAVGYGASSSVLLAFILFPSSNHFAAGGDGEDGGTPRISPALPLISLILIILPAVILPILYYKYRNPSYRLDILCIPTLISSILGLINTLFRTLYNNNPPLPPPADASPGSKSRWTPLPITALTLSTILILLSALTTTLSALAMHRIRTANAYSYLDGDDTDLLPEDEMSRRQFLKLLKDSQQQESASQQHHGGHHHHHGHGHGHHRPRSRSRHRNSGGAADRSGSALAKPSENSLRETYRLEIPPPVGTPPLLSPTAADARNPTLDLERQRRTQADRIAFPGFDDVGLVQHPGRTEGGGEGRNGSGSGSSGAGMGAGARILKRFGMSPRVGSGDGRRSPDSVVSVRELRRAQIERGA